MVKFFIADKQEIEELKKIWSISFADTKEGLNNFFNNKFSETICYAGKVDDKIVSALYLIPSKLKKNQGHYLYGAATLPEFRGKGIMGKLVDFALSSAKEKGDVFSALYPATEGLYSFYKNLGYKEKCYINLLEIERSNIDKSNIKKDKNINFTIINKNIIDKKSLDKIYEIKEKFYESNYMYWNKNQVEYTLNYILQYDGLIFLWENGYALLKEITDNTAIISEVMCKEKDLESFILSFIKEVKAEKFNFRLVPNFKSTNGLKLNKVKFGMLKELNTKFKDNIDNVYIGLTKD